jgi:hypothetical protein
MKPNAKLLLRYLAGLLSGILGAGGFLFLMMLALSRGAFVEGYLMSGLFLCFTLCCYLVLGSLWEAIAVCYRRCFTKHSTRHSSQLGRFNTCHGDTPHSRPYSLP